MMVMMTMMMMNVITRITITTMTTVPQEYGDRPPHLIHPHDDKDGGSPKKKEPHIKKPLNAFMLYMKVRIKKLNSHFSFLNSNMIDVITRRCGRWCRRSAR